MRWTGERGRTYFFQSELPYDVNETYGRDGFVGYRVGADVEAHDAHGVGVYHYFRDHAVTVPRAIACPPALEARFVAPLSVYLNGRGTIQRVINDKGNATGPAGGPGNVAHWCGGTL